MRFASAFIMDNAYAFFSIFFKNYRLRIFAGFKFIKHRNKILVEGVNRIKKHTPVSRTERGASSGGIVTQEAPIHVSNVMVVDSDGKPTRIGYRKDDESGKNVRIAKTNGKDL